MALLFKYILMIKKSFGSFVSHNSGLGYVNYKNFKKTNSGSIVLIVILLMAVLSICCITFWQKSMLFYDISLQRLQHEQKYRAASCGLDYAISICSNRFNELESGQFEIETEEFKIADNIKYRCKIYINKNSEKVLNLKSVLLSGSGEKEFEVSCDLDLNDNKSAKDVGAKKFIIKNYKTFDI